MDITSAMTPPPSEQQAEYASKDMGSHSDMMCQVLMQLGRIDAKLDMIIAEDSKEDSKEEIKMSESSPQLATNPAIFSPQLEFDLPPMF